MTDRRPRATAPEELPSASTDDGLAELGLAVGARVRFRRSGSQRWQEATVERRERDGSVGLRDQRGSARAIRLADIEVRCRGPRGGVAWEPLADVAARSVQQRLL